MGHNFTCLLTAGSSSEMEEEEDVGQHGTVKASLSHPLMALAVALLPVLFLCVVHTAKRSFKLALVSYTQVNIIHTVSENTAFTVADVIGRLFGLPSHPV